MRRCGQPLLGNRNLKHTLRTCQSVRHDTSRDSVSCLLTLFRLISRKLQRPRLYLIYVYIIFLEWSKSTDFFHSPLRLFRVVDFITILILACAVKKKKTIITVQTRAFGSIYTRTRSSMWYMFIVKETRANAILKFFFCFYAKSVPTCPHGPYD